MKKVLFLFIIFLLLFSSCKTKEIIKIETQYRDSLVIKYKKDSIYFETKDSIYIYSKNDTVVIEKFKTILKDRIKVQNDTIYLFKDKAIEEKTIKSNLPILVYCKYMFWIIIIIFSMLFIYKHIKK